MRTLLKTTALLGLLLTGCLVPTLDELDQERARPCDAEHPCLPGYACVEDHCQPEQGTACRTGTKADCGSDKGECQFGKRTCGEDGTYGPCEGAVPPTDEVCNGKDDDCDGTVDEGLSCGDMAEACAACAAEGRTCVDGKCGACLDTHIENGTQCQPKLELGKNCTEGRMCGSGFCVDGVCCNAAACNTPPNTCYAGTGTCSGLTGTCQYAPLPNNTACDDGNKCTSADKCNGAGACVGTAKVCNTSPGQCYASTGTCNGSTGACEYAPLPSTATCNDGNACTSGDTCNGAGTCTSDVVRACDSPPNSCYKTGGTCNPSTGGCEYTPQPYGTTCSDGMFCTKTDRCDGNGTCLGVDTCTSGVCTIDGCSACTGDPAPCIR